MQMDLLRILRVQLGSPVLPFCPFSSEVPSIKPKSRKKGTPCCLGATGNLAKDLKGLRA